MPSTPSGGANSVNPAELLWRLGAAVETRARLTPRSVVDSVWPGIASDRAPDTLPGWKQTSPTLIPSKPCGGRVPPLLSPGSDPAARGSARLVSLLERLLFLIIGLLVVAALVLLIWHDIGRNAGSA